MSPERTLGFNGGEGGHRPDENQAYFLSYFMDHRVGSQPLLSDNHFFCRNTSGSMPACLRIARSVPSGISPGWLGMVV